MSIKQKTNYTNIKRRPILIVVLILLIAVIALFVAKLLATKSSESNSNANQEETAQQADSQTANESDTKIYKPEDSKNFRQYEGPDPNSLEELTGNISYKGIIDNQLIIRVNIDQFTSGNCDLILTAGDQTITRHTGIINNASTSTCNGFDIPASEISSGTWQIRIDLSSNDKKGTITGEISL